MPKPSGIKDNQSFLQGLVDGLRDSARNPDIHRYGPHPKQVDFHTDESPGRLFIGGNRSGKTVGGGTEVVFYARGSHPYKRLPWEPPLRCRVVTVDLIEGLHKIVLPEIKKWVPPSDLINGSWEDSYDKQLRTLTLRNGSFIEFMTYEQDLEKFAGTSRHCIWFDEEPPKDIWTECKLRLLDTEGHWWITMTPVDGMTWTFEEIYEKNDPYIFVVEVDMDDNPHLTERGKEMALSGLSDADIEARKHGRYVSVGGLIYPEFDPKVHVIEPHDPPVAALQVAGMDHGFTNATAWLWAYITEKAEIVIFDEYYQRERIVKDHAVEVHSINRNHHRPPEYNVGDPSIRNKDPITGTSVQIEYIDNGIPILLGNNDVVAGIDRVKKLFVTRKLFITKNCRNLLWEFKRYRWAVWKGRNDAYEKNKKEEPQKKDDHACDALRYLVASRPAVEDARSIPRAQNTIGASEASDPNKPLVDKEATALGRNKVVDQHLGEDW